MEILELQDTKNLEFIGSGKNAKVYKNDDNDVVKIYREYINGEVNKSPNLNKLKIYLMSKRRDKVKRSELPKGIIFIGKKVKGVLYNYKIGDNLLKLKKTLPFDKRILYARILVESSKELTDNKIYCLDYKLDNVVCNQIPSFIDLDDWLTKYTIFKNRKYLKESLYRLKEMILELLIINYNITLTIEEKNNILSLCPELYELTRKKVSYSNIYEIIDNVEKNFNK